MKRLYWIVMIFFFVTSLMTLLVGCDSGQLQNEEVSEESSSSVNESSSALESSVEQSSTIESSETEISSEKSSVDQSSSSEESSEESSEAESVSSSVLSSSDIVSSQEPSSSSEISSSIEPSSSSLAIPTEAEVIEEIKSFTTIDQLKEMSDFQFAIMSDNKGRATGLSDFAHMVNQIEDLDAEFVVGMGDNLENTGSMMFLDFVAGNLFWKNKFWPNVADGENQHYGSSQADWGEGREIFHAFDMFNRSDIDWPGFGAEMPTKEPASYAAHITVNGITVNVLQLTFSDQPYELSEAFQEGTRQFMEDQLDARADKAGKEITVIGAHSKDGLWVDYLGSSRKAKVNELGDLALAATVHTYNHFDHGETGILELNSAHVGAYNASDDDSGFLSCFVIAEPLALVTMFTPSKSDVVTLNKGYAPPHWKPSMFIKFIKSGTIHSIVD